MDSKTLGIEAKVNIELLSSVVRKKIERKLAAGLAGEYGQ